MWWKVCGLILKTAKKERGKLIRDTLKRNTGKLIEDGGSNRYDSVASEVINILKSS